MYLKERSVPILPYILSYKNINGIHPEKIKMPAYAPKDAKNISEADNETHQSGLLDFGEQRLCYLKPQDGITHQHYFSLFPEVMSTQKMRNK